MAGAVLHRSAEPLPPIIALDACLLVGAMHDGDAVSHLARPLYQRLVQDRVVVAVCWPLLLLEFRHAAGKIANDLPPSRLRRVARDAHDHVSPQQSLFRTERPVGSSLREKRAYFLPLAEALLNTYLAPLRVTRVRLTNDLLKDARHQMIEYRLKSADALVLSAARRACGKAGLDIALASTDRDFERVDGLHLWGTR